MQHFTLDPSCPCECEDGITPHIDPESGNWFLGTTDTGVHAQGEQGIQGLQGEPGECSCDDKELTICHETPSGVKQTLTLPFVAAMKHLSNHPLDTLGACTVETVEEVDKPTK